MPKGVYERRTEEQRFWEKVDIKADDECWLWKGSLDRDGYGWFSFTSTTATQSSKTVFAHRYSLMLKLNNFELASSVFARHTCDKPTCVNPKHLIEGSAADNSADMTARNRQAVGDKNGNSTLTEEQAKTALATYHTDKQNGRLYGSLERIAKSLNVDKQIVSRLTAGKTWKHLPRPT